MGPPVDGPAAVMSRIAAIEQLFAVRTDAIPASPLGVATFDDLLRNEVESLARPARQLEPGRYGRLEPPADLRAFDNGRVPSTALVPIGSGGHRLAPDTASAFERLVEAARADGVSIGVTDSYRSYDDQVRLAEEKGLYAQGGLAAEPGTSNHGWGLALDLDLDAEAQSWMRSNAWRFGFVEDTPREPWHWTHRPS
jgi:D-alanyl-D-alanine carboxypeptidase